MIVMDTHIWLWWINQDSERLNSERRYLLCSEDVIGVSAISCFEVAWLQQHERIALSCPLREWFALALGGSGVDLLPISPEVAAQAVELPEHHRDPQDRMIIATALVRGAKLMSADSKFRLYDELRDILA